MSSDTLRYEAPRISTGSQQSLISLSGARGGQPIEPIWQGASVRFQADAKTGYSNFKVKDEGKEKDVVKRKDEMSIGSYAYNCKNGFAESKIRLPIDVRTRLRRKRS
jgi:hypothetical protein